ncbi:MAG: hypothetical protein ACTHJM_07720 [Marmoricola sp.]
MSAIAEQSSQAGAPTAVNPPRLAALIVVLILGLALAAAPLAFNMFSRAPKGAVMLSDFKPFMSTARLDGFQQDIAEIRAAVHEVNTKAAPHLGSVLNTPNYAVLRQQWPAIDADMSGLLTKVQANLGNYQAVAALPSFRLFPWFFVIPGLLIALPAGAALRWPSRRRPLTVALAILGIGLIAAPLVFQMFSRAPKGGRMMNAFSTIETTSNVTQIQDYFSTIAIGQGAIRLNIAPALAAKGLPSSEFPAIATLGRDWVHILNDMTPMIGAMSDNVANYQAIKALPPFPLFPWFFAIPGVLVVGLAVAARRNSPKEVS